MHTRTLREISTCVLAMHGMNIVVVVCMLLADAMLVGFTINVVNTSTTFISMTSVGNAKRS